jgi:hypothetical protein
VLRPLLLLPLAFLVAGCPGTSFTTCAAEPDLTGHWTLSLSPIDAASIPRNDTIEADLQQTKRPNSTLGALIWGTLASTDKGFFDSIAIPELVMNNGGKTGGVVGCAVKINVPVTTMVTDDDTDNGPLRISLSGAIAGAGVMNGDPSTLIRVDNQAMTEETFTWSAVQR